MAAVRPSGRPLQRARRRAEYYTDRRETAAKVRAWADKVDAAAAPQTARQLALSMGPLADASAIRAEVEFAEPDDVYVARLRRNWETYMQVSGPLDAWDYHYPAHLTGAEAANHPPPVALEPDEREISS